MQNTGLHAVSFSCRATKFMGCCGVFGGLLPSLVFAEPQHTEKMEQVGNFYFVKGNRHYYDAAHAPTQPGVPRFVPAPNGGDGPVAPNGKGAHSILPQPYFFSLQFKPVAQGGKFLADHGVYFNGWNISQLNANVGGGYKNGSAYTNWALLGLNLDMQRIAGIPGGQMHFIIDDVAGQGRSWEYNASDWSWINTWGNHDGLQVREFTWDQELFNKHFFILAGRSNPKGGEFEGSELYCQFATFLCSSPTTFTIDGSSPSFTVSSWSARVLIKPTASTYIKGGIWEVEPWVRAKNHNGWPGPDWGFDKAEGEFIPVEAGYHTDFTTDKYPRAYSLGFTYDTSIYSDPLYNTEHQVYALAGGKAQPRRGRTTVYAQAQQMIWKPDPNDTRGLIVFGSANFLTSGDGTVRNGFVAGLFDWGPFRSRPRDYVGLVFQSYLWNRKVVHSMNASLQAEGYRNQWNSSETMMELNYGLNVAPGVMATPYFEYIWNPDQLASSRVLPNVKYAAQVGLMVNFEINPGLNLPELHRYRK